MALTPGDFAPPISLHDQTDTPIDPSRWTSGRVMVFFYPKANTPGCTQQACLLRDVAERVGDTQIVGISPDKPKAQASFDAKYSLGYPLLCDVERTVAEAFDVWREKKNYGKTYMGILRSAFLLNDGVVEQAWYGISPKDTPVKLLEAIGVAS